MSPLPDRVTIVEVGPRDGLQNEKESIPTATKLAFIHKLVEAGLTHIEATSFVSPKAVPQLADAKEVVKGLPVAPGVTFSALAPNEKGLDRAIESGIRRVAVFTAASESFTKKNINMTIAESLVVFAPVVSKALAAGLTVRGYVSTSFVCPYEGDIAKEKVLDVTQRLLNMGVDEVAISDTIGAASPKDVFETVGILLEKITREKIALHFHDTYGTALANVLAGLQLGITTFDASAGGLGGCPYAPGASGNLATEDLVYMLERMGIATGVNLTKLAEASSTIATHLNRRLPSRQWRRLNRG
ncbi:MAG: hydroxymethylglutaryl-CoA lyase [Planctomycetota bacterium]